MRILLLTFFLSACLSAASAQVKMISEKYYVVHQRKVLLDVVDETNIITFIKNGTYLKWKTPDDTYLLKIVNKKETEEGRLFIVEKEDRSQFSLIFLPGENAETDFIVMPQKGSLKNVDKVFKISSCTKEDRYE